MNDKLVSLFGFVIICALLAIYLLIIKILYSGVKCEKIIPNIRVEARKLFSKVAPAPAAALTIL